MKQINPYINFNGNAEEAFNFYRSVFGGEFSRVTRFKEMENEAFKVSEHEADKIMYIALPIGGSILMANDVPEILGRVNESEHRSKIVVHTESREEADKMYTGLSEGGSVEMPISDSPWGTYFGMFRDKFGIEWMIEFDPNNV